MQLFKEFAHRKAPLRHTHTRMLYLCCPDLQPTACNSSALYFSFYIYLIYTQQFCSLGPGVCQLVLLRLLLF